MDYIVIGSGRVGAELAYRLYQKGHTVTVVDHTDEAFSNLNPNFRGRTIEGEVLNEDVLRRAGIESASGLAVVTSSDSINAVVGYIARSIFHVPNIVVRNYEPNRRSLIEAFGLQVVASSSWGAQRIEELLEYGEVRTVFSAGNGEVEIYEFSIPAGLVGRTIGELLGTEGCSFVALTRAGQAFIPSRDTALELGDILLVSATDQGILNLRQRFLVEQET
jgi:trk system potassium uptake protein TrkA